MDGYYDREKKKIKVNGQDYEPEPSMLDRFKEGFSTTQDRAQVEAIRRMRQRSGG